MSEVINKRSGKVALPEAGQGAYLQFTTDALETLESALGDDYLDIIIRDLAKMKVPTYRKVIGAILHGSRNAEVPYDLRWEDLNIRILDAMHLAIHGRTYEEQLKHNEEELTKRVEKLNANPRLAAALSLISSGQTDPEQD